MILVHPHCLCACVRVVGVILIQTHQRAPRLMHLMRLMHVRVHVRIVTITFTWLAWPSGRSIKWRSSRRVHFVARQWTMRFSIPRRSLEST